MTAHVAERPATYADLEAAPPHLVAEIVYRVPETHPRPAPRHASAAFALAAGRWLLLAIIGPGAEVRRPPFDAIAFPFDDLFPFDPPGAAAPSTTG